MIKVCVTHAVKIEEQRESNKGPTAPLRPTPEEVVAERAMAQARWDAEQAKLPPRKRRTIEQADADDEAAMGRAILTTSKRRRS